MVRDMSNTATTSHFDAARLLLKFRAQGMTFAEVTAQTGAVSTDDLAAMTATFRADSLRADFAAWMGLVTQ